MPKAAVPATVDELMKSLDHPLKAEIETVRRIILAADRRIGEGVKWNAPSFHAGEYFATVNLRSTTSVQLILHRGAKVRKTAAKLAIDDPAGLLKWLDKDRCLATLGNASAIRKHRAAFTRIVRQWIGHL